MYQSKTKDKKSEAIKYGPKTPARMTIHKSKFWTNEKKADGTDKNVKFFGHATDHNGVLYKLSIWDNEKDSVLDKVFKSKANYPISLSGTLECLHCKCEGNKPTQATVNEEAEPFTEDKF